jgi:hypothetical protein
MANLSKKTKVSTMTTFNQALTIEEARTILQFNGTVIWPNTKHNREIMADATHEILRKLQGK